MSKLCDSLVSRIRPIPSVLYTSCVLSCSCGREMMVNAHWLAVIVLWGGGGCLVLYWLAIHWVFCTLQQDKLKHIRKEAASRKAQLRSAAESLSNSPEFSRHSKGSNKKPKEWEMICILRVRHCNRQFTFQNKYYFNIAKSNVLAILACVVFPPLHVHVVHSQFIHLCSLQFCISSCDKGSEA